MTKEIVLKVEANKPLEQYGDGHMIVYDDTKRHYYVTTRETFLRVQNEKIDKINENFKLLREEFSEFLDKSNELFNEFMKNSDNKYKAFLETYKNTNEKMIAMIKSVVVGGE